jgi:hypothetical protein
MLNTRTAAAQFGFVGFPTCNNAHLTTLLLLSLRCSALLRLHLAGA